MSGVATQPFSDARGQVHELSAAPRRVVSLVPSLTETLFALGIEPGVVGVTDFCVHPAAAVSRVAKVGGTKNPDLERILALDPDLVLANQEENRKRDVQRLEARGVSVFVTYARTVDEAVQEIICLGQLFGRDSEAAALRDRIDAARHQVAARRRATPTRVEALIWKKPYMLVGGDTFAHDLLRESGGRSAFSGRDQRYPRVDASQLEAAAPEVILLPTEPYAFAEKDREELLRLDCPAARSGRIHVVEGELLTWYGPRIARALRVFSGLLA